MSNMNDPVYKDIVTARVNLLFNQPFFGNLATRLELVDATKWCPTAATDGRRLYYNREFIKKLTRNELLFLIGHEVLHCVYDHLGRRGSRAPDIWNMANDYIVNATLVKEKIGDKPDGGLLDSRYTDEWSSEQVYNDLMSRSVQVQMPLDMHIELGKDGKKQPGDGKCQTCDGTGEVEKDGGGKGEGKGDKDSKGEGEGGGGEGQGEDGEHQHGDGDSGGDGGTETCPDCNGTGRGQTMTVTITPQPGDGDGKDGPVEISEEDLASIRNEVKSAVIQAATNSAGKVPAGVRRMIQELTEPKMDWREMLEMHIKSSIKDDFTFQRISRKSWACGAILPGMNVMDTVDVALCIDTSGSMSDKMLKDFLSEVKGIMETFQDFVVRLWTFDTKVYSYKEFRPDNLEEITEYDMKGGGGTDFMCNWDFMKAPENHGYTEVEPIEPNKFVMFTDGYPCGEWGEETYCDTLFVIHSDSNIEAPFGMTAYYEGPNSDD